MKKQNGITIVALAITITVLLILSGISIATINGNNGTVAQAKNAKERARGLDVQEKVDLAIIERRRESTVGKIVNTKESVIEELFQKGKLTEEEVERLDITDIITIGGITIDFSELNN